MGIKGLLIFLRAMNEDIVQEFNLSLLEGQKLAVDIPILAYQKKSEYIRKTAKRLDLATEEVNVVGATIYMAVRILHVMESILVAGVIPVAVFDGRPPSLKDGTKGERSAKSIKKKNNIRELKRILRGLLGLDAVNNIVPGEPPQPYAMNEDDLKFLKSFGKPINNIHSIRELLLNEVNQAVSVAQTDYLLLAAIFTALGIPQIQAQSEAEQTCAQMCRHRDVAAIFTTDSDCLVYGCPIMINKISYAPMARIKAPPTVQCYSFVNVLKVADLTNQQFMDFCYMLGTDFNKNVPGYGPKFTYELIKHYGSVRNIIKARKELHKRGLNRVDYMPRGNMGIDSLTKIEKLCYDYDVNVENYEAVMNFFTTPVTYNKANLELKIVEGQFEIGFDQLVKSIGIDAVSAVTDIGKSICGYLLRIKKAADKKVEKAILTQEKARIKKEKQEQKNKQKKLASE